MESVQDICTFCKALDDITGLEMVSSQIVVP